MGIANWLGFGKEVSGVVDSTADLIDRTFTSDEERNEHEAIIEKLKFNGAMMQAEQNKSESKHRSIWVAGWRPAIGWTCASALFYAHVAQHVLNWILLAFFPETPLMPAIPQESLETLTWFAAAILGVYGSQRTIEKLQGKTK